jgi:hypothetical protein
MGLSLLLGFALTASYRWCMVIPGILRGILDSLHQRLWPFIPTRGFLETAWESCPFNPLLVRKNPQMNILYFLSGRPSFFIRMYTVCLGLPCKVLINRLSPSHRYPRLLTPLVMRSLMMEDDEYYAWLIVLYNFVCTSWLM